MKLNPEKSALLVIDMQEGFLNPESPTYIPMAWDTVPACAAVQRKARELGIPVKFIGVGEKIDDMQEFDAEDFVSALFGE